MTFRLCLGLLVCCGVMPLTHANPPASPDLISAAIADHARPAADIERDRERKPAELLAFAGIRHGDKVADLMPGGGYFTCLFSKVVGRHGHVYAVVPDSLANAKPERLNPLKVLLTDSAYPNLTLVVRPYQRLDVRQPLDLVWTSDNYHDVYGAVGPFAVAGTRGVDQAAALDSAVFKALKPGGVYLVVDHAASAGASEQDAHALHRIDPATVIEQAQAAGFVLEARSDLLGNPQDDHDKVVFAPEIRGHTDQFVLKFRKPQG